MKLSVLFALLTCANLAPAIAAAEPGGVSGVSGPRVTRGESAVEVRSALFRGRELDDTWVHRAQAEYAFTDWWRPTVILRASQPVDGPADLSSVGLENTFDFTPSRKWPVHLGGLFEYKIGLDGAEDEYQFKLLAEARRGDFSGRLNLIVVSSVAEDAEVEPSFAARGVWHASEDIQLQLEAFGEPEENSYYLGPRLTARVGPAILAVGYLAGIDGAKADHQFRFGVEIPLG